MEEPTTDANKTPNPPPTGRFMDIQSPTTVQQESADKPISENEAEPAVTQTSDQTAPTQVVISPDGHLSEAESPQSDTHKEPDLTLATTEVSDVAPVQPVQEQTSEAPEPPASSEETATESTPVPVTDSEQKPAEPEHPHMPHKTNGTPLIAVVLAIIVALTLSGLVIFTFIKSKNDKLGDGKTTSSSNSQANTTAAKPQASPEDVDQVSTDIDTALSSIDETADFATTDMSDQSLGL